MFRKPQKLGFFPLLLLWWHNSPHHRLADSFGGRLDGRDDSRRSAAWVFLLVVHYLLRAIQECGIVSW